MNIRLVAEVLKQWRSDPEERALGEVILHMLQIDRQFVDKATLVELVDTLEGRVNSMVDIVSRLVEDTRLEKEQIELERVGQTHDTPNIEGRTENEETYATVDENTDGQEDVKGDGQKEDSNQHPQDIQDNSQEEIQANTQVDLVREKIRRGRKPNVTS